MALINKQATFEELMPENLEHCLNAVTVCIFPNRAYKLQKWCIWHMMHNLRHMSACKWIARVIKLKKYPSEFPTPANIEATKMDQEKILEVLENRIPTL
eukprot:7760487-Ditylum_brightwellii.AAC.2